MSRARRAPDAGVRRVPAGGSAGSAGSAGGAASAGGAGATAAGTARAAGADARAQVPARLLLRVDPITCEAHGLCAELVPELLTTDEWGYPDPIRAAVPRTLEAHARRAAKACPTLAIRLDRLSS